MTFRPAHRLSVRLLLLVLLAACTAPAAWAQALSVDRTDFGTRSIGEIQIPLVASGGDGTYVWEFVSGELPPGVSLRADRPSWFPPEASAGLIGVATTPETYDFTLRVRSGDGQSLELLYTVKISPLVVTSYWRGPDAFVGRPYSRTLTAMPDAGNLHWEIEGGLPAGMTLSPLGVLSGTPDGPGSSYITFTVSDGQDTVWRDINLDVYAVEITTPGELPNATQNAPYTANIVARGGSEGFTFTITSGSLPNGLGLNSSGGIFGTANTGPGKYSFDVAARDTSNVSYTKRMAIDVIGVPRTLPSIGANFESATLGRPYVNGVWVSNGGTAPFTWTAAGLPPGLSIVSGSGNTAPWRDPGDLEISGAALELGTFDVTFTVTDGNGKTATNTFPLHVSALANQTDSPPGTIAIPYTGALRIIGGVQPYTAVAIEGRLPAGVTLDPATLELSGTPLESGGFGTTFLVTDAANRTLRTQYFLFINNPSGIGIHHGGDLGQVTQGEFYSNQLSACCVSSYTWSHIDGLLPPGLTFSSAGQLSGTPNALGLHTFLIRAADAGNPGQFSQRQFTIVVTPLVITENSTLTDGFVSSPYSKSLTATGGTGPLTWTVSPRNYLPPGLTLSPAGTLAGEPTESGQYSFELRVTDADGHFMTRLFHVSNYAEGDQPPLNILEGSDFGTRSIGEVQNALRASGGNGTYVWELVDGALPTGVSLRTDGPSWFPSDYSAGLIGVATVPGVYNFTLKVMSGAESLERAFTIKISPLVVTTYWDVPDTFVDKSFSYTLTAANAAGPLSWAAQGGLPDGVTLSSMGVLSGIPTESGFYSVWLNVSDGVDTVGRQVNLLVHDIEITTPGALPNAIQNASYSATIAAEGGSGSHTFTSDFLPSGLVLSPSGIISGTVNTGPGNYGFNVTATDTSHVSYSKRMAIDVIGVPPALPAIGVSFEDVTLGWPLTRSVWVGSGGTAPFTWTATGLPPGVSIRWGSGNTVSWVTPGELEITGAPTVLGMYNVRITVTDANNKTATNTFPLLVSPLLHYSLNTPPGTIFVPYSRKLRIIGGKQPYTAVQVSGRLPAGVTFDPATFDISGIPLENGGFGTTFVVTDASGDTLPTHFFESIGGGGSTIGINHGGDLGFITQGESYSNQLFACCVPSPITWMLRPGSSLPPGLTLTTAGQLSGTPTAPGTYPFLVRAADAENPGNFAQRQFTMVVTPLSILGNFTLPDGFIASGSPYSVSFNATGGTGALSWTVAPGSHLPPGLILSTDGTLSGTPTASGQFFFELIVTDGAHQSRRWFGVSIYGAGDHPPLSLPIGPDLGTWSMGGAFIELSATGGVPPYHYSLTPLAATVPGMRVQDGPPLPSFFPPAVTGGFIGVVTAPGTYTTSIRVTDSAATPQAFDREVTVTVSPLRTLSHFRPPKATVGEPYSFAFVPYGASSGNDTWSADNLPPGLTMDSSGQLFGTPTQAGTFFPSLRLTDLSTSESVWEGFALVVDPFAITTGGVLPSGTVQTFYSQRFAANCGGPCTWTIQGGLPSGLSMNSSAETLSGTPQGTFNSSFTVQASGSAGTVQKIFSLRIASASVQALTITTGSPGDRTVGDSVQVALFAQGGTPPYTWSLLDGSLPTGVSLQSPGEAFSANFAPGFTYLGGRAMAVGTHPFTLKVTDSLGATATRALTWHISPLLFMDSGLPLSPGTPLVYNTLYTHPLLVVGGTGAYSWTSAGNPMPPGLTVGAATGLVSGTPLNTGSFSSGIQVTDGVGNAVLQNVSFFVAGPTSTLINFGTGSNLGSVAQGFNQTRNLSPSGGTPPYTVTALSALPPGLALLSGDSLPPNFAVGSHVLSFTPLATGPFSFTLQAQDAAGNIGVRTFTGSVTALTLFSPTTLADGSVNTSYSQSVLAWSDAAVTWSLVPGSALPPGLGVSPAGVISGTPTQAGTYSFALTATKGATTVSFDFTVRISSLTIADEPVLPPAISGVPYSHTFTATGGGSSLVWSATQVPFGLTMFGDGRLSGTITSAGSTFTLVVTLTDGAIPVTRRFVLFARPPNPGQLSINPVTTALGDVTVGQSVAFQVNANFGVPPYTWSVAPGSSLPEGLSLVSGLALPHTRTPASTLLAGAPTAVGLHTFDLIATDSALSQVRRTYTLRVSAMGILQSTLRQATAGLPYASQLTAVGGTPPYTFSLSPTTFSPDTLPPGFALSTSGLISGTTTSTGSYEFLLRVQDSASNVFSRIMTLDVANSSGLRVFGANPADGSVGGGRSEPLFTSGSSTYTWSLVAGALPAGMALLTDSSTNTTRLAGQPATAGTHVYTLRATQTGNPANFADHQFTFRVAPMHVVSPPVRLLSFPDLPTAHVGQPYSFALKVAGGTPPYSFVESPFAPLPAGLTLSASGVLEGTPLEVGVFGLVPTIADSLGVTFHAPGMRLVVTPVGVGSPLQTINPRTLFDASLGVPYSLVLDTPLSGLARGGEAPYSWSLAGGSLPPGMALLPGANGVPNHLGGVPSVAGTYGFSLTVSDSSGQSSTVPVSLKVSTVALSPDSVPPGLVGSAYSASLVPSGGTPPYAIQLDPGSDLPPGLTLAPSGMLFGTPTHAGNFAMAIAAIDNAGGTVYKPYRITIDNAAGQAPALILAPRPIQVYYEQGSPEPAPLSVSVSTTSGALPFTLALSGLPGAILSATNGTTSSSVELDLNVTALAPGTYVGMLGAQAPQSANLVDSVPVTVTVAPAPPCSYTLNPSAGSVPAAGGAGSFDVASGAPCSWTATTSDSWITITSGAAGAGAASVSYSVAANAGVDQRNGAITVNGQVYTVTQFGSNCSFAINPVGLMAPAAGGMAFISITASDSSCAWQADGLGAMPPSGTGSGGVTVSVPPSGAPSSRILTATIATQTLTVMQAGIGCTVSLSPYDASAPAAGVDGSVTVATPAGCAYDTVLGPSWISVTSGGSGVGPGTLVYSVEPNSTTVARSGSLVIGGQAFQVTQDALPCSVTIDTSGLGSPYGPAGGAGLVSITTSGANCSWTASSGASWAAVAPSGGTGNATIGVTVGSNMASAAARSTDLTIAGQAVTILQAGTMCTYSLQSGTGAVPFSGGSGSVGVVAPSVCSWTAATNDPTWLSISSSAAAGTGNVLFVAQPNTNASPRTGTLTIAGLTYWVTQAGAPCSYTLGAVSPTTVFSGGVTNHTFTFSTTASGCTPVALSYVGWITASATFAGNSGEVTYTVAPNPATTTRAGTIQVGEQTLEIRQSGGACGYSLNAYGALFDKLGGTGSVLGSPTALGCSPDTGTDQPSIVLLDPLSGPLLNIFTQGYHVTPYDSLTISVRRARITFGGQIFTVKQTSW